MEENKIGALLVEKNRKLIGIFSEKDYPGKVKTLQEVLVKEIMSSHVIHLGPDDTIEYCMKLVTGNHVYHLPVLILYDRAIHIYYSKKQTLTC